MPSADAVYNGGNPGCGDVVTVYLSVDGPEQITRLSFEGEGCTISQASASMVMEMMQGKSLHQIEEATPEPLLAKLGPDIALQGNLDPLLLLAPPEEIRARVRSVHEALGGAPGHIFNLGHGVLPQTPVAGVAAFVDAVKELGRG